MSYYVILSLLVYTLSSHSIIAQVFQEKDAVMPDHGDSITIIQQEFRNPAYAKDILPHDFSHLSHLLSVGHQQPPLYMRLILKSFTNMIKRSPYINAAAFSTLLETLPKQVMPYFSLPASANYTTDAALYDVSFAERFPSTVNNLLYKKFSEEYESFRANPHTFLSATSNIITIIAQEEVVQEQLRQHVIRFCETALSKLMWNPEQQEQTWITTKHIAEQLAQLLEYNILDDTNDLEDLYLTLLTRYCYFVEIAATDMPPTFFAAIRNDLKSNNILLFALTEQDNIMESKLAYMQRTLLESETAAYRYQAGISKR
jgi:hypothetical protein